MTSAIGQSQKAVLVALLMASTIASAHGQQFPPESPRPRALFVSKNPAHEVPEIFVAGGVVSTLRFVTECDPSRTKMLGWEGRFEPLLVGGKTVVIVPLKDLDPQDRFMLLVTLMDGTSLPFTITSSKERTDGQVNLFPDQESSEATRWQLQAEREESAALREENLRHREEETSVDHALAALLLNDQIELTPFQEGDKWVLRNEGLEIEILVFIPKRTSKKAAKTKVGVVFNVLNKEPTRPWELQEARLSSPTTRAPRPFALRATPSSIAPGKTGRIAIITDLASFEPDRDGNKLVLELFRNGGQRQAYVELIPSHLLR
nr:DUF2381 family protein [Vitiosangium sp. GDMCC 1.1324]